MNSIAARLLTVGGVDVGSSGVHESGVAVCFELRGTEVWVGAAVGTEVANKASSSSGSLVGGSDDSNSEEPGCDRAVGDTAVGDMAANNGSISDGAAAASTILVWVRLPVKGGTRIASAFPEFPFSSPAATALFCETVDASGQLACSLDAPKAATVRSMITAAMLTNSVSRCRFISCLD